MATGKAWGAAISAVTVIAAAAVVGASSGSVGAQPSSGGQGPSHPVDGIYLVGGRFVPGVYQTVGQRPGLIGNDCRWARYETDPDGRLREVETAYSRSSHYSGGQANTVTIKETDTAFGTTGCSDWFEGSITPVPTTPVTVTVFPPTTNPLTTTDQPPLTSTENPGSGATEDEAVPDGTALPAQALTLQDIAGFIPPFTLPTQTREPDGVYLVGSRFTTGTYTTAGPEYPNTCAWGRLVREVDGYLNVVQSGVALPYTDTNRTAVIAASDVAFSSSNCGEWRRQEEGAEAGSLDFGSSGSGSGSTGS